MPQVVWKPEISLGNVGSLLATVVVIVAGWTTIENKVATDAEKITKLENRVSAAEARNDLQDQNFSTDRLRQTEILTEMKTDLRYLRSGLDEIKRAATLPGRNGQQ